jgi:hypothetical protein
MNLKEDFEEIISKGAIIEYFKLYNDLATQIGIFYDELFGFKSALRLVEANKTTQKSLNDVFAEIDTTLNNIRIILSSMRQQESPLIFAANISTDKETLSNYKGFANLYKTRKIEISRILENSDFELGKIKTEIIDKIKRVNKRNIVTRKWNEYKTDFNKLNVEITHVDEIVMKYAKQVDTKFELNLVQIINS